MTTFKTYLFSAMALGTMATGLTSTAALADHRDGRGRGYGRQVVDVYIDAGRDSRLEAVIGNYMERANRKVNIVYSPRYADVTVRVNGYLSRPEVYDRGRDRRRGDIAVMEYNYTLRVSTNGRTIFSDRIRGQVDQPLDTRYGYHRGSGDDFDKAERALELFGVFIEAVTRDDYASARYPDRRDRGGYDLAALERSLTQQAYAEIAARVADVYIPAPRSRRR